MAKRKKAKIFISVFFISLVAVSAYFGYNYIQNKFLFYSEKIESPTFYDDGNVRNWQDHVDNNKILSSNGYQALNSVGDQNILVVPVSFQDEKYSIFSNVPTMRNKDFKETLNEAFFGEGNSIVGWESVKSFYEKSSYSKLTLNGEVTNVVNIDRPLSYYSNLLKSATESKNNSISLSSISNDLTITIIEDVLNNNPNINFEKYDQNKDGYFDAVWFIYNSMYDNESQLAWAFTTANGRSQENLKYKVGTFSWGSYFFMTEGNYQSLLTGFLPDAHTYIHETGHILGLEDYYSYANSKENPEYPVGGLDMMDYNIGDHMAFSKYLLNWISPKEIIGEGEIKIKPFYSSGEAYIIANNYNGTAFDEYLILEYYVPEGLNSKDSKAKYLGNNARMFTDSGLRIYHVDARIGYFKGNTIQSSYVNNLVYYIEKGASVAIVNNNTSTRSLIDKNNRLVELVSANNCGDLEYISKPVADNSDLFTKGKNLNKYFFNDGSSIPYTISIEDVSSEEITIKIQK